MSERTVGKKKPSRNIPRDVERRVWAESMGRCMNPACEVEIDGIGEKAHIVPFADTHDNSVDNLIMLCPNCHTDYDKTRVLSEEQMRE